MMVDYAFILVWVGLAASILAIVVPYLTIKWRKKRESTKFKWYDNIDTTPSISTLTDIMVELPQDDPGPILTDDLARRMEQQILLNVLSSSAATQEQVQEEVKAQLTEVHGRIKEIENRFPDKSTLEKIASINDGLLSERIDQLAKQVDRLEKERLSRWDVLTVVGYIIGGIILISGATYGVLKATGVIP